MIQLRNNGAYLTLPANITLTREIETTIFNRELTVTDYSFPVDFPLDDNLKVALGFPNSIANPSLKQDYTFDFIVDGIYIDQVILRVLTVNLKAETVNVSVIGKYGAFARLLGGKKLNQLVLGGVRTVGSVTGTVEDLTSLIPTTSLGEFVVHYIGNNVVGHINAVNNGTSVTDYVFAQCVDDLNNLDYQYDGVNVLNPWNYNATGGVGVVDPVKHYLLSQLHDVGVSAIAAGALTHNRFFWVPQFKYAFLIRKCFEEFGFTVNAPILSASAFAKLVMPNSYAINKCSFSYVLSSSNTIGTLTVIHDATKIDPRNHVPGITVVEFLQEVGKAFNLQYNIDLRNLTVSITQIQNASSYGAIVDITASADPEPTLNFEEQDYSRGYAFSFADTSYATVPGDLDKYRLYGTVQSQAYMAGATGATINDLLFVANENAYYQWDGTEWIFYSDNLGTYKTSTADNLQAITTKVQPVKMRRDPVPLYFFSAGGTSITAYDTGSGQVNPWIGLGIKGQGIFMFDYTKVGSTGTNPQKLAPCFLTINATQDDHNPHIASWYGLQASTLAGTPTYPLMSAVPNNAAGTLLTGYALGWTYPFPGASVAGLANDFWAKLVAQLSGAIEAEYLVLLDAITLGNIDWNSNVIRIKDLLYLCKKATLVLPTPNVATLQLVRV